MDAQNLLCQTEQSEEKSDEDVVWKCWITWRICQVHYKYLRFFSSAIPNDFNQTHAAINLPLN